MNRCILCKKDLLPTASLGINQSVHDYAIIEGLHDGDPVGELCDGCGEKIKAGKITNVLEAVVAFFDQLDSFNDLYHPEVHKRAIELQKAVGEYLAPKRL